MICKKPIECGYLLKHPLRNLNVFSFSNYKSDNSLQKIWKIYTSSKKENSNCLQFLNIEVNIVRIVFFQSLFACIFLYLLQLRSLSIIVRFFHKHYIMIISLSIKSSSKICLGFILFHHRTSRIPYFGTSGLFAGVNYYK